MSQEKGFLTRNTKLAIEWLHHSFSFMYPWSFSLRLVGQLVVLERKSGFWKFVPWYISLLLVTGLIGLGSCLYVAFSYAFDFRVNSTQDIPIFIVIVAMALGSCATSELIIVCGATFVPEFQMAFNQVIKLVFACKLEYLFAFVIFLLSCGPNASAL